MTNTQKLTIKLILLISFVIIVIMFLQDPMPQSVKYHSFVDDRGIFGVVNFYNVISNFPFLLVGIYAIMLLKNNRLNISDNIKYMYYTMFFGVIMVFFGSSYFHLDVRHETLFLDRLPMVIVFMALFSIVISEFISLKIGKKLFIPLVALGLFTIIYWIVGESYGSGDLRWYILVQFLPMLITPIILLNFKRKSAKAYWYLLLFYVFAKLFEHFDGQIFELFGFISGHSIKHIVAALGLFIFLLVEKKDLKHH
ncbi:hypothetical protein BPUTSESOX_1189 [uncultured Gammaproteobacteria bacterium]|nr:hypothetical protein BPUTSESOX_1189 [uncultured Gammaproteobacteria bacterium]